MDRRDFLKLSMLGGAALGIPALRHLWNDRISNPLQPTVKVKSLVVLFMTGGPSQIELFDHKPELIKSHGKVISGFKQESGITRAPLMRPLVSFSQYGDAGAWVSDLLPNLAQHADDLTFVKSINCLSNNHALGQLEFNTGTTISGNPFSGAWINQGLGYRKTKLPRSVVMTDVLGYPRSNIFAWQSGNLPHGQSRVVFSAREKYQKQLQNFIYGSQDEHEKFLREFEGAQRIAIGANNISSDLLDKRADNFRLIYSMREVLQKILDLSKISKEEQELYGLEEPLCNSFAEQLVVARNLVEKEVPFVQIYCGNEDDPTSWDHHFHMDDIRNMSRKIDQPIAGFLADLKRRGLLDQTLVLWGGEFGRLPVVDNGQKNSSGRGHNENASTIWMAGAGLKKGITFGETDELSLRTVRDRLEMGDIWATILHLMGVDHRTLIHNENGVEKRFTRPYHQVVHEILA